MTLCVMTGQRVEYVALDVMATEEVTEVLLSAPLDVEDLIVVDVL